VPRWAYPWFAIRKVTDFGRQTIDGHGKAGDELK
jgi:hypothetical protein